MEAILAELSGPVLELSRVVAALRRQLTGDRIDLRAVEAAMRRVVASHPEAIAANLAGALPIIARARHGRRITFSRDLSRACAEGGVTARRISDQPEEWRIGHLTIAVQRAADRATVRYARLPVVNGVACEASAVIRACRTAAQRLHRRSHAPDDLWNELFAAYGTLAGDDAMGTRVAINDLIAELGRRRGRYPRVQLAYDLGRLIRERRLVRDGVRIDLGVATGHVGGKKRRLLWLEDASGAGQYHETFRLIAAPSAM